MKEETWKLHASFPSKPKESTPPNPPPLSLSSMAQLDQNLCRRKKNKKERKKEWEKQKEREVRCVQMSSNQTHLTKLSLSLSPNYVPRIALLQAPKKSHLHHWSFKRQYFSPSYVGFLGFFVLVRVSQRKQESENLLTSPPLLRESLSLYYCVTLFSSLYLSLSFSHVLFHHHPPPHPTFFFLSIFLFTFSFVVASSWLLGCFVLP